VEIDNLSVILDWNDNDGGCRDEVDLALLIGWYGRGSGGRGGCREDDSLDNWDGRCGVDCVRCNKDFDGRDGIDEDRGVLEWDGGGGGRDEDDDSGGFLRSIVTLLMTNKISENYII
jgi:hypothetical protein